MTDSAYDDRLPAALRGTLTLPVVAAPLFIVSDPDLVIAQCLSGIVGSFPALNARPADLLDPWLSRITGTLAAARSADPARRIAPFAVNQIVHASNDRLARDVAACVAHEVPIVITSLRAPEYRAADPSSAVPAAMPTWRWPRWATCGWTASRRASQRPLGASGGQGRAWANITKRCLNGCWASRSSRRRRGC